MISRFLSEIVDFLAPRRCPVCGARLTVQETVACTTCTMHFPHTDFQLHPYENDMARLFYAKFHIERAAALYYYQPGGTVSQVVASMKYEDHPENAYAMGRLLARAMAGNGFFEGIDVVVPIPLATPRQRRRGYNQSEEMARGIGRETRLPIDCRSVRRIRDTQSQTTKTGYERVENMRGAFLLQRPEQLAHKHVLLVDDVVTTGSTVAACAEAIKKAPGVKFSVIALGFTRN